MKSLFAKSLLASTIGSLVLAGSAFALPVLMTGYDWTSADYWSLTDLNGNQGAFELRYENPNASYESAFGLYTIDEDGAVANKHEVFSHDLEDDFIYGSPVNTAAVFLKKDAGNWFVSSEIDGTYQDFDDQFGFYFDVYRGGKTDTTVDYTWYTDMSLNIDGYEHVFTARNSVTQDTQIWLEDLAGAGDGNLDMMVASNDIAPVPEPATMLLFGTGLACLTGIARKRKK